MNTTKIPDQIDVMSSILTVMLDSNRTLHTLLDVFVDKHVTEHPNEKEEIIKYVDKRLTENYEIAHGLLVAAKDHPKK